MAKYKSYVITKAGLELLAAAYTGGNIEFTSIKTGSGSYDGTEDLSEMTALKDVQQSFGLSSVTRTETQVKVRSVISNEGVENGYYITEIGLFAKDASDTDILYAVIISDPEYKDYMPPSVEAPTSMTLEIYLKISADSGATFTAAVVEGTYATPEDLQEHVTNSENPHNVTKVHIGLENVPNVTTNDQTPTYSEASTLIALTSGEKLSVAFGKIAKAISSLISHLDDAVSHITVIERTNWNDANSKKHSHENESVLDAITAAYTTAEKNKLSGIATGAQVNTITGVKGNAESSYRTGNVNITPANLGITVVNNTADNAKSVKYAASAGSATSATKATQDASGNVITSTYKTKAESVNVYVGSTAPTDTTAVWIVTS